MDFPRNDSRSSILLIDCWVEELDTLPCEEFCVLKEGEPLDIGATWFLAEEVASDHELPAASVAIYREWIVYDKKRVTLTIA